MLNGNNMSKWEKRLWLVLAIGSSLGVAFHFGNAAVEKLEAIRVIGERSLVKVENAGQIVSASQPAVAKAATNSDTLVGQGATVLEKFTALEERADRFEQEMRGRADRVETKVDAFIGRVEWRFDHPFDTLLGRKPTKEAKR